MGQVLCPSALCGWKTLQVSNQLFGNHHNFSEHLNREGVVVSWWRATGADQQDEPQGHDVGRDSR